MFFYAKQFASVQLRRQFAGALNHLYFKISSPRVKVMGKSSWKNN